MKIYHPILIFLFVFLLSPPGFSAAKKQPPIAATSPYSLEGQAFDRQRGGDRLSEDDRKTYVRIFSLQDTGDFRAANDAIEKLKDHRLMGWVLYQRYTNASYMPTARELTDWMKRYGDEGAADVIYTLAQKRGVRTEPPRTGKGLLGFHDDDTGQAAQPYLNDSELTPKQKTYIADVRKRLSENPTGALAKLNGAVAKGIITRKQKDALAAEISASLFYNGKPDEARALAVQSSNNVAGDAPLAGWTAGLASWKAGSYGEAATHFERAATSRRASDWMKAAAAHWAARAHLRNRAPEKVGYWLKISAEYPRSFYGILSTKMLGMEQTRFHWNMPDFTHTAADRLAKIPAGRRALALSDAERPLWAEKEMQQISPGGDKKLQDSMLSFAHKAGMPALEMRLGNVLKDKKGNLYDSALYPDPPWQPISGYQIDRALIHAFIRQESKFRPDIANKGSGATGLMQLMPKTAAIVAKRHKIGTGASALENPAINMHLGQKYLGDLLKEPLVAGNLFKLAVAYNAGPGKMARWLEVIPSDDPLFFIESIPSSETRNFVERVMTNYWIYRLKYDQPTDSLMKVAEGGWPLYAP